jgi:hypothetical protein
MLFIPAAELLGIQNNNINAISRLNFFFASGAFFIQIY